MDNLSTSHPEIQSLALYLDKHPDSAQTLAIEYKQQLINVLGEYQKLQTEYLAIKAQRKSPSAFPVSTFILSFITSLARSHSESPTKRDKETSLGSLVKITRFTLIRRRKS